MRFNWLALLPIGLGVVALFLGIKGGYGTVGNLLGIGGSSSSSSSSSSASQNPVIVGDQVAIHAIAQIPPAIQAQIPAVQQSIRNFQLGTSTVGLVG